MVLPLPLLTGTFWLGPLRTIREGGPSVVAALLLASRLSSTNVSRPCRSQLVSLPAARLLPAVPPLRVQLAPVLLEASLPQLQLQLLPLLLPPPARLPPPSPVPPQSLLLLLLLLLLLAPLLPPAPPTDGGAPQLAKPASKPPIDTFLDAPEGAAISAGAGGGASDGVGAGSGAHQSRGLNVIISLCNEATNCRW